MACCLRSAFHAKWQLGARAVTRVQLRYSQASSAADPPAPHEPKPTKPPKPPKPKAKTSSKPKGKVPSRPKDQGRHGDKRSDHCRDDMLLLKDALWQPVGLPVPQETPSHGSDAIDMLPGLSEQIHAFAASCQADDARSKRADALQRITSAVRSIHPKGTALTPAPSHPTHQHRPNAPQIQLPHLASQLG